MRSRCLPWLVQFNDDAYVSGEPLPGARLTANRRCGSLPQLQEPSNVLPLSYRKSVLTDSQGVTP